MHCSFDFYDDKLCLDSFKLDTVLGRHGRVTVYITLAILSKARHSAGQARPTYCVLTMAMLTMARPVMAGTTWWACSPASPSGCSAACSTRPAAAVAAAAQRPPLGGTSRSGMSGCWAGRRRRRGRGRPVRCPGARPRKELAQPSIGRNILIYIVLKYIYTIFETGRHDVLVQLLALFSTSCFVVRLYRRHSQTTNMRGY